MILNNLFNAGSTGGVGGGPMFANSPSAGGSDGEPPLGPAVSGAIESQVQLQLASLQQMLAGCQNGGSGEQVQPQASLINPQATLDPLAMLGGANAPDFIGSLSGSEKDELHEQPIISDEEFRQNLSAQEKIIWSAMVIAIHAQHVNRLKAFQRRRFEHLKKQPNINGEELERKATEYLRVQDQAMQIYNTQLFAAVSKDDRLDKSMTAMKPEDVPIDEEPRMLPVAMSAHDQAFMD
jgi:hypothetical protein